MIQTENRKAGPVTGAGAVVVIPFTFKIFNTTDIVVTETNVATGDEAVKVIDTDYVVAKNPDQESNPGGTVTSVGVVSSSFKWTLTTDTPKTQLTDLVNAGGWYPQVMEDSLDKLTAISLEQNEKLDRAVLGSPTLSEIGQLPAPVAGTVLGWDAAGEQIVNYVLTESGSPVSASSIVFTPAGTGAVATTVQEKLRESPTSLDKATAAQRADVAAGTLAVDVTAAIQSAADSPYTTRIPDGSSLLSSVVTLSVPKDFVGNGKKTLFSTTAGFGATPIFKIAPAASADPKNWTVSNFGVTNTGSATSVFKLDIDTAGRYVSKLTFEKIISNAAVSSGRFFELSNAIPNTDGFFTSVIQDNWSFGGYYLNNIGDSVFLYRNTTMGAGTGYYVNQLGEASHVVIDGNNCTCLGGALEAVKSLNLRFQNNQCEVPGTFAGVNDAVVSFDSATAAASHQNPWVINNNINTQANATTRCIYADWTNGLLIDGNTLFCNTTTGTHIYIDSNANDTHIGVNKYYRSDTGAEVSTPLITDNGVGTGGIWKDATITLAGWTAQNTANEHPPGFFKDREGIVQLRGRVAGAAVAGGETLFTLPVGFRPKTKAYLIGTFGAGGATIPVLQILSTGAVQILTANTTGVYLAGVTFSTR